MRRPNVSRNLIHRKPYLLWFALCVLMLLPARADAQRIRPDSLRATRIQAVHRDGQTFISWFDADTANVRGYRILRHSEPITDENVVAAAVIADSVGVGTGLDYIHQAIFKQPRGFVITDLGGPLLPGQGLYVHTVRRNRSSCYAVVSLGPDGRPVSGFVPAENSLKAPVSESLALPQPVLIERLRSEAGVADVYTHWVDEDMHPREGMAYRFAVTVSHNHRPETRHPLHLRLHGAGGWYGTMHIAGDDWVVLYPDMRTVTYRSEIAPDWNGNGSNFWYGLNSHFYDRKNPFGGVNVNYDERRVLWTLRWVMARYNVDPDRVHVSGGSMGGYATLNLALRHPELFASASAWVPPVDFHRMSDYGNRIALAHWGPREANILTNEGVGIYDRADLVAFVRAHPEADFPVILMLTGKQDQLITWKGPRLFYDAMQETRHALLAVWSEGGHAGPKGSLFGVPEVYHELDLRHLRRNESYPALSFASTNDEPGATSKEGAPRGQLNAMFEWKDIVDRPNEYGVTLAPLNGRQIEATADVTLRRLQGFRVDRDARYTFRNVALSSGKAVQEGVLKPDSYGLLTVHRFIISGGGNRLLLSRVIQ